MGQTFTFEEIVGAYTLWCTEYRANPDDFMNTDDMSPEEWAQRDAVALVDYIEKFRASKA